MKTKAIVAGLLAGFFFSVTALANVEQCDLLAGHPSDPDKVGAGVGSGDVVTHRAIPACRAAVAMEPDNGRLHYQLGRVLTYWAGANGADNEEGVAEVRRAADLGHTQAQFVLSLLLRADARANCEIEALVRTAARKGLKSARITYVNDSQAGLYAGCKEQLSPDEQLQLLDAAQSQISGYYESMLLTALRRGLAT